ncbi:MAG: DUF6672 family protein [Pyramidobacter sp.]
MNLRRIIVNLAVIAVLTALGFFCYDRGKAYDFIVDNTSHAIEGQNFEGMEAVMVSIDGGEGKVYYADDRDQTVAIGSGTHTARIDVLDLEDKPIEGQSKIFSFTVASLGNPPSLSIPFAYKNGKDVK